MQVIDIREKLKQIECPVEEISLGDFDKIGEHTARRIRGPSDPLYKSVGCFYRPNYERGILIYHLVKRFEVRTLVEVGFGRGYAALCAAKAMCDMGWDDGRVFSVDPKIDEDHLKLISQAYPKEWFQKLNLLQGTINDALGHLPERFDMAYVDGDHRLDAVRNDWDAIKGRFQKLVLFDDYDPKDSDSNQVRAFIDGLDADKELIRMDRRIFADDRGLKDADVGYGQVLVRHPAFDPSAFLSDW